MELQGKQFGRLIVLKRVGGLRVKWSCICSCGKTVEVAQGDLRTGDTSSCGCLRKEARAALNTTHNMTNTYTYKKWKGMWARVRNVEDPRNACYRGITVCKEWSSFENFYLDMGEAPPGFSLDRRDNAKGYNKNNCRWVPLERQAANTTRNVVIEFNGHTAHISEHARMQGLAPDTVFDRINKLGWGADRALSTPKLRKGSGKKKKAQNEKIRNDVRGA